jgi:hypothetical protein
MGFDVYSLEHGDRGSEDTGTSSAGVGHAIEGRLGGRVAVGAVGVKKWVAIHDERNARGSSRDQRRLRRANTAEAGASDASSASTAGVASG